MNVFMSTLDSTEKIIRGQESRMKGFLDGEQTEKTKTKTDVGYKKVVSPLM